MLLYVFDTNLVHVHLALLCHCQCLMRELTIAVCFLFSTPSSSASTSSGWGSGYGFADKVSWVITVAVALNVSLAYNFCPFFSMSMFFVLLHPVPYSILVATLLSNGKNLVININSTNTSNGGYRSGTCLTIWYF